MNTHRSHDEMMLDALKADLANLRQQSLAATRTGDYMKVARITAAAADLNKKIMEIESRILGR